MIGSTVNHCPRPVGSTFRQRSIWAAGPRGETNRGWTVSVVDTIAGPIIEAHAHHEHSSIVATDAAHHSIAPDVIRQAVALLDAGGWDPRTVQQCGVWDCENPVPMWMAPVRRGAVTLECLTCSTRTVLACVECGAPDGARTTNREQLLADSVCFGCGYWRTLAETPGVVTADWHRYEIGDDRPGLSGSSRGFGGRRFVVRFDDGRVVETSNLWTQGIVPEWFRDRVTPNAAVASPEPRRAGREGRA